MTEHQTLNTVVHAAFRRTITRFDGALAAFPDGSQQRADQLKRAWDFFEEELHHHHGYEEDYFWPALQQTDADLSAVAEIDSEHEAMREASPTRPRRWWCYGQPRRRTTQFPPAQRSPTSARCS